MADDENNRPVIKPREIRESRLPHIDVDIPMPPVKPPKPPENPPTADKGSEK
jgi:hypothetical protein